MEILISTLVILLLMFLGMKVFGSFLAGSLLYVLLTGSGQATVAPLISFSINNSALLAVPLFMLAGGLLEISGIADRLVDFANVLLRRTKNGMGATIPVASMFFGALCGSGTATVAVLGNILMPKLERMGWPRNYTAALLAASGPLGYMIPPNMNAILYSVIANESVSALFLATIIPGILWGLSYVAINRFIAHRWVVKPGELTGGDVGTERERFNTGHYWRDLGGSFWSSIPALMLPVLMMGGIYSGICTATEAGAVGCVYALVMGVFAFRKINRKNGLNEFVKAGKSLGSIFIIFPMVMLFSRFMLIEGVPQLVVQGFTAITENKYVILILMNIVLLLAGMFFDASVLTLVITPLLLPTAAFIGLDAIQLGVIIFVAIGIGTITPPMAMNLFVVSSIGKVSIKEMMSPLLPYLLFGALPILLLVTFVPAVSLWLPALVLK